MRYHDITKDDMKNGDGLRTVLWVSGCDHACPGCQNPVTWDPDDGLDFDEKAMEELTSLVGRDYMSGLTFSGGDPLFPSNRETVCRIAEKVKTLYPDKNIWLYTGFLWEEVNNLDIMQYVDVCIDGPYMEKLRDVKLKWRGSSNQRVIDVRASLEAGMAVNYCEG